MSKKKEESVKEEPVEVEVEIVPSFIVREVDFGDGVPHLYEKKVEESKDPIIKAIGYARIDDHLSDSWISYTAHMQHGKILKLIVSECVSEATAADLCKVNFGDVLADRF
jgi:hypothetical protein